MGFGVEVSPPDRFAERAATQIADLAPTGGGSLVLTGGTTVEPVYSALVAQRGDWSGLEVFFSDERCVPPDDAASNYAMAKRTFLDHAGLPSVHRMRGEDEPEEAARSYHAELITPVESGFDLVLLGMGADGHIAALFPYSDALRATDMLCSAVQRPDGLGGLTLTPPALWSGKKILLLVTGGGKAETVRRVIHGDEPPEECPARLLADQPDVTFLLDEPAASRI